MQRLFVFGVVIVAAVTSSHAPRAQAPTSDQRVWTGTWEEHDAWQGSHVVGRSQAQISFVYVQGRDEFGGLRWASRRLTWSAVWEESRFDQMILGLVGDPDERGLYKNRYAADIVTFCAGGGTLELGPAVHGFGNDLTPAQRAQLLSPCVTTSQPRDAAVPAPPVDRSGTRELLQVPGMPHDDDLTGCAYETSWPKGGRPAGSFSVSVSPPLAAVMEVDPDPNGTYGRFVPIPGETLTFVASVPAGTARFRFELDPAATSRFPGYATNANVDDAFLAKHGLHEPPGQYANESPDVIFHPRHHNAEDWSRIDPLVVETRTVQSSAVVTVTAMDYGAVGTLRAFVKSEDCGDWQPVPVRFGRDTRESVAIPMDEDHNLMADAVENYRGLDSGADDDSEPRGNGMAGDGLTAFEEYRGFVIRGAACEGDGHDAGEGSREDEYIRSAPHHKNLFVHTLDPDLVLLVDNFAWSTGLSVHAICEPHYVNHATRIVNFTLQTAGLRQWRGHAISQAEPQHGVYVKAVSELDGDLVAIARGIHPEMIGPPRFTTVVEVLKPAPSTAAEGIEDARIARYVAGSGPTLEALDYALRHELGHVVGVPHHSDTVTNWRVVSGKLNVTTLLSPLQTEGGAPDFSIAGSDEALHAIAPDALLVEPGPECLESDNSAVYREGSFAGCLTPAIARRGQQNSGDHICPMRYRGAFGHYYEPPHASARFLWSGEVVTMAFSNYGAPKESGRLYVDAWGGRLLRYQSMYELAWLGHFCESTKGTGINDLRGDLNHNGNAARDKPCSTYLVVNDMAARGAS